MLTETSLIILLIGFLGLLVISVFYSKNSEYLGSNIILVIISYFQGLIVGTIFYSDTLFLMFLLSILSGVYYYLLVAKLSILLPFIQFKWKNKAPATLDAELTKSITMLWGLPDNKIHISIYPGESVFKKMSFGFIDIYVGDEFLKNNSRNELLFALSHEIGHTKTPRRDSAYPFIFPFVYEIIIIFTWFAILFFGILNIFVYFIAILILFIIGIMISNYLAWRLEFKADELGLIKSKNLNGAISLFEKFFESQKDYGQILNLIFYDHPLPRDRIKHFKEIKLES